MDEYKGKLNIENAKKIIADHYDIYLHKEENPCSRTVCSHYDLDAREYMSQSDRPKPYAPHGVVDGCVTDSTLAKKLGFYGRFGNSCGIPFNKDEFCNNHRQWEQYRPYLLDRPTQPWTYFSENPEKKERKNKLEISKKSGKNNKIKKIFIKTKKNRKYF